MAEDKLSCGEEEEGGGEVVEWRADAGEATETERLNREVRFMFFYSFDGMAVAGKGNYFPAPAEIYPESTISQLFTFQIP